MVSVRVLGPQGEEAIEGGGIFTVPAGSVGQLPLTDLAEGTYTVEVSADVSVVAGAVTSRGTEVDEPVDIAVAPSGERLGSEHLAVLPNANSVLTFAAPSGAAEVRLTGVGKDGALKDEQVVAVAAGTTAEVPATDVGSGLVAVLVSTTGDAVYGAQVVTSADGPGVSVLPLPRGNVGGLSVPVGLGY
ncbi:DUF5719 family protein [Arthrobacter sp. ATA002]|uniref:DUF5719 family protein n=1 Tax=Arthrobacter sp. ATA002 TaxID=2991715 RepID=UPI0022A66FD3|nr:DUF5719 family protein [Arthrobacter sp. ATA002]WAP51205.1 DUF5719 family protein [Arthrobacter sp. ATA002]